MQQAEFQPILSQLENELQELRGIESFYEMEKQFTEILRKAGQQLFQETVGKAPENYRKKNCGNDVRSNRNR